MPCFAHPLFPPAVYAQEAEGPEEAGSAFPRLRGQQRAGLGQQPTLRDFPGAKGKEEVGSLKGCVPW